MKHTQAMASVQFLQERFAYSTMYDSVRKSGLGEVRTIVVQNQDGVVRVLQSTVRNGTESLQQIILAEEELTILKQL
ncbi:MULTISPECIES: hypothetical protein [Brevibacillus]|uniref:Uncharacterized protein n=1 Tax=Brevibacillus thermoruber TaxID=33942 RepID=A0A9X3Z3G8_9BACL|nr:MULTISPECIES: hypothetical protein [Brevibacillus]MDA5108723.1 hypothetical protein [Brevibacillus thermoruber]TRY24865.1 hypothetical protein FOI68_15180 [Brevibacillus sp. LEMMJ03]UYZ14857.1 hypothetical protein A6764_07985 [Brevibacillus sp. WF146]